VCASKVHIFEMYNFFWYRVSYVSQAGLELMIFLRQPPNCWDCRCVLPYLAYDTQFDEFGQNAYSCDPIATIKVTHHHLQKFLCVLLFCLLIYHEIELLNNILNTEHYCSAQILLYSRFLELRLWSRAPLPLLFWLVWVRESNKLHSFKPRRFCNYLLQ
jgi:hypothetical protein